MLRSYLRIASSKKPSADCDAAFLNTGQVCLCAERVYVQRPIFDRFVAGSEKKAESLRMGSPLDKATEARPAHFCDSIATKFFPTTNSRCEEGATVITGGGIPRFDNALDSGFYVQPTIYTGLPGVGALCERRNLRAGLPRRALRYEEEAVSMANDTKYGLAASIWTTNLKRGHRVAQQMNVGITWVNCWFLRDLRTPFGGVGLSGIGREGGMHSLNFYSELNNICIRL